MAKRSTERYFKVGPRFWADSASWSEDARTLALYILTCPHRKTEGLYKLPQGYILGDLDWSPQRLAQPFEELIAKGFIQYDKDASVVLITKALKWQAPANPNGVTAAIRQIEELPETGLLSDFYAAAQRYCQRLAEGLAERFPERLAQPLGEPQAQTQAPSQAQTQAPAGAPDGASADLRVGNRRVSDFEQQLARDVVRVFNEIFSTSAVFEHHVEQLVERFREQPDLSAADHRRIIEGVWNGEHWWSGAAGLGVIYSSGQQFTKAIDTAAGTGRSGLTATPTGTDYDKNTEVHHV